MTEQHPREETNSQRLYERRKLRTHAEILIKRHGQPFSPDVRDARIRFENGLPGHLLQISGRIIGNTVDIIKINEYHTEDVMGPMTQYTSERPGEFTRADLNPSEMVEENPLREFINTEDVAERLLVDSAYAAANQLKNEREGIDGYPITAKEAQDVLAKLKLATIERSPSI